MAVNELYNPIAFILNLPASTPEEMREEKKEQEGEKSTSSEESKAAKVKASKPLMPTSTILRLLAELVRSYMGIATLIASYSYTAGQSELIKEVSSSATCFFPFHIIWLINACPHTCNFSFIIFEIMLTPF